MPRRASLPRLVVGVALALLFGASPVRAAPPAAGGPPPSAADAVAGLERSSRELTTLRGEFVQKNRLKLFAKEMVSRGRFAFEKPRRIRWEYTDPDPSVLVLDGTKATISTPGAAPQVFDLEKDATMRAVFDQLLLWFGGGSAAALGPALAKDYDVSTAGTAQSPVIVLTPKPTSPVAKAFQRISLRVDPTYQLRGITLVEKNGDEKDLTFTKLDRNQPLPPATFK